jgi:hypothetical protein
MTLREKFKEVLRQTKPHFIGFDSKECEQIAKDYAIEVLESYHNSLFNIPLKEGEAKRIVEHIKKENGN